MPRVDKIIVTNVGALRAKYLNRYHRVWSALLALRKADADRGITTRIVSLDDAQTLRGFGGAPVSDPDSARETKAAIDAVWQACRPDYLMILGAPDIVCHQNLTNPLYAPGDDDDQYAPSDLPYACDTPYSQAIADFRGPTRVVGRLPDLYKDGDAAYMVRVLRVAATRRERLAARYDACFALTAEEWRKSTALSLGNTFSTPQTLHRAPPEGPGWKGSQLGALTHFINCHGGSIDPRFYGQRGNSYPIAMRSSQIEKKIRNGTVAAAECCYGAQLYDPNSFSDSPEMGICNRYLKLGAYAFFGSSTEAYGPSEGNGSADLICQFFIQRVLFGASTGRAALEARLQFVLYATHLDPTDLKTLAQFNLMGDPSAQVVGHPVHALQRTRTWRAAFDGRGDTVARQLRRKRLLRDGRMLNAVAGAAQAGFSTRVPPRVKRALEKSVRDAGFRPGASFGFGVDDPARRTLGRKAVKDTTPTAFYVMSGSRRPGPSELRRGCVVVATMQDGRLVRLRRLHRRG